MSVNTSRTFDDEEIRDKSSHNGSVVFNGDFIIKTLIVENGLNQIVSCQCQGSAHSDFSNSFDIGGAWNVSANTTQPQTCDSYYPYWRVVATCDIAPASGGLTVIIFGVSE